MLCISDTSAVPVGLSEGRTCPETEVSVTSELGEPSLEFEGLMSPD